MTKESILESLAKPDLMTDADFYEMAEALKVMAHNLNLYADALTIRRDNADPESNPAPASPPVPNVRNGERLIPWGKEAHARYGMEFIDGVVWIESQLGLKVQYLMACMKFESGLNHKARNPQSSASGLIQFMAATATQLGTNIEAIRTMDVMTQLSYVYRYFMQFESRGHDLSKWDIADTYMAILWPAGIGKPMNHPIFAPNTAAYKVNKGLDSNKDGFVTKAEAAAKVIKLLNEGLQPGNVLVY